MKVLLISRAVLAASYQRRLRELARIGVELTVITPPNWEHQKLEYREENGEYRLQVCQIGFAWPALGKLAHHTFYYKNASRFAEHGPWDIVHIDEEPFNFASYRSLQTLCPRRAKVVFFTWQNILKNYPPPFSFFEGSMFRRACAAVAGNAEAKDVLRVRGFSKPITVIPQFGVDAGDGHLRFDRDRIRKEFGVQDRFIIGYIGRIVPEKGIDTLVHAVAHLPREATLVVVGSGGFQKKIEEIVRAHGLSERVRWVSWVSSEAARKYTASFDVLVLPSRTTRNWKEQFGRVLLEAMACETCVVGSDSGEIPNVIGDAGLVFHEGNELELAAELKRLMDAPSLRESLGRRGRQRVLECFSHARHAKDTLSLYEKICAEAGDRLAL